ncbi:MAG: PAS domain S-box protein, partial [Longimicrobiales bacterium]
MESTDGETAERTTAPTLRMSEERYQLLADHVQDMLSLHDLDGVFLYASPAARLLLGYEPAALLGRSVYDLAHPDDVATLRAAHETVLTRTGRNPLTYRAIRADGSEGWFETTARVTTFGDDGVAPQVVALTRDVSERRVLEQQVAQMQKLEAVGRLAGGLAHDFNNLLTVVLGRADSLLERVDPASELSTDLEEIRGAALRASGMIAQLLAIGRRGPV